MTENGEEMEASVSREINKYKYMSEDMGWKKTTSIHHYEQCTLVWDNNRSSRRMYEHHW